MYLCYSTYEKQFVYSGIMSVHFGKFWEVKLSLLALTSHFDHFIAGVILMCLIALSLSSPCFAYQAGAG